MADEFADLSHIGPPPTRWPVGLIETLWMVAHMPGVIRRERPDVIFIAGNSYTVVAVLLKLWLGRRCPPVVAKMSNDLDRPDLPWAARWLYHAWLRTQGRFLDRAIAIAPAMRRQTQARLRLDPNLVVAIPNPAMDAPPAATVREPHKAGRSFVFVGRLTAQKDLPLLLHAFARGRRAGDTLTLIGNGPAGALRRLAKLLSIEEAIAFGGYSSWVAGDLSRHDALVLSSRYEGLPSVVIEALAAGLSVVATDCSPAMSELLEGLGLLVPVGDVEALARAIASELEPPCREAALSRVGAHRIERSAPLFQRVFAELARTSRATEAAPRRWRPVGDQQRPELR